MIRYGKHMDKFGKKWKGMEFHRKTAENIEKILQNPHTTNEMEAKIAGEIIELHPASIVW